MSYTIKNLRETSDSAPKFGLSEIGEAHFVREELGAESTGLAYHVLNPGKRQPFGHRHEQAEEIYAVRVGPSVKRAFEAGPDGLSVLVFGPHHEKDGEVLNDFWQH
jgi:hypothetical protein